MTATLIRAGANVKASNNYGVSPIILAATNGNAPIINQLLAAGVTRQHHRSARVKLR